MSRISTSSSGGNVNIQGTDGSPITTTGGALDVNVVSSASSTAMCLYNETTGVAMGASTSILTYTVPSGKTLSLNRLLMSSDSISTIEVDINGVANAKARICYTNYNITLDYNDLLLSAGTVITLMATNNSLQGAASFNATLQGALQ